MRSILARLVTLCAYCCCLVSLPAIALGQTSFSVTSDDGQSQAKIEKALLQRGSIEFTEVPLRDVASKLAEQFNVQIVIAIKKLEEASVSQDTPITKQLTGLTLGSILKLILKDLELTYVVRDEVLSITTPEDAESQLDTRVYPVLDLVTQGTRNRKAGEELDYDSLIEVIIAIVAPHSWDDVGGPGAIDQFDNAGALVVSQTRDVHEQIAGLLTTLRKTKTSQGLAPPKEAKNRPTSLPAHFTATGPIETWQLPQVHAAEK